MERRPRPEPGSVIEEEMRIPICAECGYTIDEILCNPDCPKDGATARERKIITAVYEVRYKFIRDEDPTVPELTPDPDPA